MIVEPMGYIAHQVIEDSGGIWDYISNQWALIIVHVRLHRVMDSRACEVTSLTLGSRIVGKIRLHIYPYDQG